MSSPTVALQPDIQALPTTIQRTVSSKAISNSEDAGFDTDLFLQIYHDRLFVVVSQYAGKIGSLLQVTVENNIIDNSKTFDVLTLLGAKRDDSIQEIYARQLLELIESSPSSKSHLFGDTNRRVLLLGISLRDRLTQENFNSLLQEVLNMYEEALATCNG